MVGWHAGNWHWKVAAAVNIPAGAFQRGELSNVALIRWLGDFSGAITYLDPELGIDLSTAAGLTVNGENPDACASARPQSAAPRRIVEIVPELKYVTAHWHMPADAIDCAIV